MSHFYNKNKITSSSTKSEDELIYKDQLGSLIIKQQDTLSAGTNNNIERMILKQCNAAINLYTILIKLKIQLNKSWDIQTFTKSILVRFDPNSTSYSNEFYKDISLKIIDKVEKLSKNLNSYSLTNSNISDFINNTISQQGISIMYMNDGMVLLWECWSLCNINVKHVKNKLTSLYMKAKLLLIEYELTLINDKIKSLQDIESKDNTTTLVLKRYAQLDQTVKAYKGFINVLLENLEQAEVDQDDVTFNDCMKLFNDIEAMYAASNIDWLLEEYYYYDEDGDCFYDADETSLENSNSTTAATISKSAELNMHSRTSSVSSTGTDVSLMMERTTLTHELPFLLQAFDEAKNLEKEIKNVKSNTGSNTTENTNKRKSVISQPSSYIASSNSTMGSANKLSNLNTNPACSPLPSPMSMFKPFFSGSPLLNTINDNKHGGINNVGDSNTTGSPGIFTPMTSPLLHKNQPIFKSGVLNNLYGLQQQKQHPLH
ncbi:Mdm36p SCDLUD_000541 [Saccharomycodes ludwigii]|uniref:Mdm36p n=1 Tax=Saccharomycodes ludwigii TaxID=36035 RepID=UPI001E8428E5|nr:hypothetical protein SCDLUD_000541 [Saccharomycodes ludwigii]KAH3902942.1 hypothetical protein SCDLUD_000541 [Saccharomycodes ludwigii]